MAAGRITSGGAAGKVCALWICLYGIAWAISDGMGRAGAVISCETREVCALGSRFGGMKVVLGKSGGGWEGR